jgi:hypothetical protein
MNSGTVFAGIDGCTSMTRGMRPTSATGVVSRTKLKRKLSNSVALMAFADMAKSSE